MIGFVRRLLAWLHRRGPADGDPARIIRKGDRGEPQADTDPIQELVRIVGEFDASDLRPHRNTLASSRRRTLRMR